VLATVGLLEGRQATAYPGTLDGLPGLQPSTAAVVQDGLAITSRGPRTAMDFALKLVLLLCGPEQRQQVEAALQRSLTTYQFSISPASLVRRQY
jgi:4-methyl-5(b-hydroxyethyl)-thiazole monophosphate biosynthesis